MVINYQRILLQLLIILIFVGIKYLVGRFFHGRHQNLWQGLTTCLLFVLAGWNFGPYWIAYPVLVWMVWALSLIIIQVTHNHEFIYRRYWTPFWRVSLFIAVVSFITSFFAGMLPLV